MTYVPRYPTTGWMVSELERRGHRVRGLPLASDDKTMARMLRDAGLVCYSSRAEERGKAHKEDDEKHRPEDR